MNDARTFRNIESVGLSLALAPAGDATYSRRHTRRNNKRVAAIMSRCTPGEAALDIGCNVGYFSRELLRRGLARAVDAIEYDPDIVADDLKLDPRFHLHGGDALEFTFPRHYHVTIYGALHHHLFAVHGYSKAMRFWSKIVDHTEGSIFLESGQLAEGSRWYWQRALRAYYSSDEDYFSDLLCAVGPRLKTVHLIGGHWIHGVRRWLFQVELWPREGTRAPSVAGESVSVVQTLKRTIGSTGQKLVPADSSISRRVHDGISFQIGTSAQGDKVFCKSYLIKHKEDQEIALGVQIGDPRFVAPLSQTPENGLVFPLVDLPVLDSVSRESILDKAKFRQEILDLFRFAESTDIACVFGGRREVKLIDVIDLHSSNILFDESRTSFRVVDLEIHSLANAHRNRMHLAKILLRWGARDLATLKTVAACVSCHAFRLLLFSFRSPERRVVERTVSVLGWAYVRLREKLDDLVVAAFPRYRQ